MSFSLSGGVSGVLQDPLQTGLRQGKCPGARDPLSQHSGLLAALRRQTLRSAKLTGLPQSPALDGRTWRRGARMSTVAPACATRAVAGQGFAQQRVGPENVRRLGTIGFYGAAGLRVRI